MDTKHLLTFVTLAKEKTYIKTSTVLNYAPSTLTTHIAKLEQELGVQLIETVDRQSALTAEGKNFLPYALDILNTVRKAQEAVDAGSAGHRGHVTICAMDSLTYKLAPLFTAYHRNYPDVDLVIKSANSNEMAGNLREEKCDVAFLYNAAEVREDNLQSWYLFYETMPFCVSPTHRLATKKEVGPLDLRHETFFQQDDSSLNSPLYKLIKRENLQVRNNIQVVSGSLIRRYAIQGLGVAVLPKSMTEEDVESGLLVKLKWTGKPLGINGVMLSREERRTSPAVKEFIAFTNRYYGRM